MAHFKRRSGGVRGKKSTRVFNTRQLRRVLATSDISRIGNSLVHHLHYGDGCLGRHSLGRSNQEA